MPSKPYIFAELKVGEMFISFPMDGDDHGHGGYRGGYRLFTKIEPTSKGENAVSARNGVHSTMPDTMKVIRVV